MRNVRRQMTFRSGFQLSVRSPQSSSLLLVRWIHKVQQAILELFHSVYEAVIAVRQHIAPHVSNHPAFLNGADLLPTRPAAKLLRSGIEGQNHVGIAFDNSFLRRLQRRLVHITKNISSATDFDSLRSIAGATDRPGG